jgi:hypothetical protein
MKNKIELKSLGKVAINTKTQEEFDRLMLLFEEVGLMGVGRLKPCLASRLWSRYKLETGVVIFFEDGKPTIFVHDSIRTYRLRCYKILYFEEYLKLQGIKMEVQVEFTQEVEASVG